MASVSSMSPILTLLCEAKVIAAIGNGGDFDDTIWPNNSHERLVDSSIASLPAGILLSPNPIASGHGVLREIF